MTRKRIAAALLSPKTERLTKRVARQQKHVEKHVLAELQSASDIPIKLTGRTTSKAVRIQNLSIIEPLTDTQEYFFNDYSTDDESVNGFVLYGSAGTGKCQGPDVEVNLIVSDELYEKLIKM